MYAVISHFEMAVNFDQKDIFVAHNNESKIEELLEDSVRFITFSNKQSIESGNKNIKKHLNLGIAMSVTSKTNPLFQKMKVLRYLSAPYFLINEKKASLITNHFITKPDETLLEFMNLVDNFGMKFGFSLIFDSIKYKKKIHITPKYPEITKKTIK
mmetsp:Transcript_15127/g.12852  ORF Transcript_15127/g.12852 Transcript_15127/m.12852 type:complete len:156 (-) Transcript_15127:929-1396(-)